MAQFVLASADKGKTVKREDFIRVLKGCNQNPNQQELELVYKELKFETKPVLTYEEGLKVAQYVWFQPKPLTKEETERNKFTCFYTPIFFSIFNLFFIYFNSFQNSVHACIG
jgi:hypothetical protein